MDGALEESGTAKKMTEKERHLLRDQVHHANLRVGDSLFHGASTSQSNLASALVESSDVLKKKEPVKRT